jgi:hypothetical protein
MMNLLVFNLGKRQWGMAPSLPCDQVARFVWLAESSKRLRTLPLVEKCVVFLGKRTAYLQRFVVS